eukprot:NODE_498_length_6794_cov_0.318250.p5 type:complete len:161 gc:universal NODE_498_length_6794_cov_0.318250:1317-1799(+)
MEIQNANPIVQSTVENKLDYNMDEGIVDLITPEEIYHLIAKINDPEHPLNLEQLRVVNLKDVLIENTTVINGLQCAKIKIYLTPTIPHCSMATLIGLTIRVKLMFSLPDRFKVFIYIKPGSHQNEAQINRQLNDKERVCAALENPNLIEVVNECIRPSCL